MATYKEIQAYVLKHGGFFPKSCWIAHVKEMEGLNTRIAANRISDRKRKFPCPPARIAAIVSALRNFRDQS